MPWPMGNNSLFLMYLLTASANHLIVGNTIFPLWWWDASLKISRSWFVQFWRLVQQVHCILVLKLLSYSDCYLRYQRAFVTFELKCISDSLHDNTTRVTTWDFSVVVIGPPFCLGTACGSVPKVKCLSVTSNLMFAFSCFSGLILHIILTIGVLAFLQKRKMRRTGHCKHLLYLWSCLIPYLLLCSTKGKNIFNSVRSHLE